MADPRRAVTTRLTIGGMTSVHAVRAVETALTPVPGIVRLEITLGRATIEHDGRATPAALRDAIAAAGYEVREVREERGRLPIRDT
jgi:copper chaperone CopZ